MAPSLPNKDWLLQRNFPDVKPPQGQNDCLIKVQSRVPDKNCIIQCGSQTLQPTDDFALRFEIIPSPIHSYFLLDLVLDPAVSTSQHKATAEEHERAKEQRIYAIFSTYDAEGPRYADRRPYNYQSNHGNTPPAGPLDFSQQLYNVTFCTGDKRAAGVPIFTDQDAGKQLCFSWKAVRCHKSAFSRPLDTLKPAAANAARQFMAIIRSVTSADQPTLRVTVKNLPLLPSVFWPWFAAVPAPVPESYWPWVYPFDPADASEVMQFPPNRPFERAEGYVDLAFAVRSKGWLKTDDVKKLPQPLKVSHLDTVVRFTDYRQYLAVILGGHGYEELHSKSNLHRWFNGRHSCDLYRDETPGSRDAVILLNIRPPLATDVAKASDNSGLPAVNERVDVNVTLNRQELSFTGQVIRIPSKYAKYGRNVAILAQLPPGDSGRVEAAFLNVEADFYFGHYGSPVSPIRDRIIEVMTGADTTTSAAWFKRVLLAQDSYSLPSSNEWTSTALPKDFKSTITAVCDKRHLNKAQREVVQHYFTHKFTVVCGPPGTGKSTLIDAIAELEEIFNQKLWLCTESNAAITVLAEKICVRKGSLHPGGFLRLKPAGEETLTAGSKDPKMTALPTLPARQGEETPQEAISRFFRSVEAPERVMTLEATIKSRFNTVRADPAKRVWPKEDTELLELAEAYRARFGLKMEQGKSPEELVEDEQRLDRKLNRVLRHVQAQYAVRAKCLLSTTAAACGPFLRKGHTPNAMIMDEASQFLEARAVHPILHAVAGGSLARVLLIGDEKQLPPTIMADRNPFAKTAELSLFERLIKSGLKPIRLVEQFRMHPTISSVCNATMYGNLIDGANTTTRSAVKQFKDWVADFATRSGAKSFSPSNAIVVSPVKDAALPWTSSRAKGSTSRYNVLNARMVFMLAYELIAKGHFVAKDIMVVTFYSDQKAFLEALFADFENFNGIRFDTVDGSQGSEAPVVIIDCVVYGQTGNDGMGFLGAEQRRFNVAMSRAQSGRITIAHRDMITKEGKDLNSANWNTLFSEARKSKAIIDGGLLNRALPSEIMQSRFKDVFETYQKSATEKQVAHKNIVTGKTTAMVVRPSRKQGYERTAFMEVTGAGMTVADEFLEKAKGDLPVAINAFFSKHGSDLIVEEV